MGQIATGYYTVYLDKDDVPSNNGWSIYPSGVFPSAYSIELSSLGTTLYKISRFAILCGQFIFFPYTTGSGTTQFFVFNPTTLSLRNYVDGRQITLRGPNGKYYTYTPLGPPNYAYDPRTRTWSRRRAEAPVYMPPWVTGKHIISTLIEAMWR